MPCFGAARWRVPRSLQAGAQEEEAVQGRIAAERLWPGVRSFRTSRSLPAFSGGGSSPERAKTGDRRNATRANPDAQRRCGLGDRAGREPPPEQAGLVQLWAVKDFSAHEPPPENLSTGSGVGSGGCPGDQRDTVSPLSRLFSRSGQAGPWCKEVWPSASCSHTSPRRFDCREAVVSCSRVRARVAAARARGDTARRRGNPGRG
jgi:hypothetical protein